MPPEVTTGRVVVGVGGDVVGGAGDGVVVVGDVGGEVAPGSDEAGAVVGGGMVVVDVLGVEVWT